MKENWVTKTDERCQFSHKLFVKVGLAVAMVGNGIPTALHEFELEVVIASFLAIYLFFSVL